MLKFKVGLRTSMGAVNSLLPRLATTQTREGSRLDFASLRGRWVALHFWTNPADIEIRQLKSSQEQYGDRAVFVGVELDSPMGAWRRTVDALPANWVHVRNGTGDEDLAAQLAISNPKRLLIDPFGRIVGRYSSGDREFFNKLAEIGK